MVRVEKFLKEYIKAISEGYAAVFAGAGLSCASGYVNWKELLRPLAEEIELDVDVEHDLISIAQYYRNSKGRNQINQTILNNFTAEVKENENINIITDLPINTYWTTNYDTLIEDGVKRNNRKPDVKVTEKSLAINIYDRDAVIYKMHGDVSDPDSAILTKDDYDKYGLSHPLFRTVLRGDLVSKTFLFVGFSFEDPNLDYILSSIKVLLDESVRDHYCILRRVNLQDYDDNDVGKQKFHYDSVKQGLRISDLQRYGIQSVLIDDFDEITKILLKIKSCCLLRNIFISGSVAEGYPVPGWSEADFNMFLSGLGRLLIEKDCKIVSGFGLGIGSPIVNGALEEIMSSRYKHLDEHLALRPFPQNVVGVEQREEVRYQYREKMIEEVGIVIFISGYKMDVDGNIKPAKGVMDEFEIAKQQCKYIVPIGSTDGVAKEILEEVKNDINRYLYLQNHLDILSDSTDAEVLKKTIFEIIDNIRKTELGY